LRDAFGPSLAKTYLHRLGLKSDGISDIDECAEELNRKLIGYSIDG
jgi:hypothetical protein